MDTDDNEFDDREPSCEFDTESTLLNDPVEETYNEAIDFVEKVHPENQQEIIAWFDKLKVSDSKCF